MQNTEFISAIRRYVRDAAISSSLSRISDPPGRAPKSELVELSRWYNALDDRGKDMVRRLVEQSVDLSLFSFFCVLDGVRSIEDEESSFKLYYAKGTEEVLLNDPDEEYLHDLYNAE